MAYAHSSNETGHRHDLVEHLRSVAVLARGFAPNLHGADAAYYLGLWHDLGKFHPKFQQYLLADERDTDKGRRGPDHKAVGSSLAVKHLGLMALLIQGHHGGLRTKTHLSSFLDKLGESPEAREALTLAQHAIPDLEPAQDLNLPSFVAKDPLAAELFLRLLFSALVDADFLDTEAHFSAQKSTARKREVDLLQLWERFKQGHEELTHNKEDAVGRVRNEVYQACLNTAERPPGLFRLTVPTGGGKTLSSMAFALRHALKHGQKRVIVAVPFINITEQTVDVYRKIFQDRDSASPIVLEHHSGGEVLREEEEYQHKEIWRRLAVENWDAPIVVTTTVQLFESLFANSTSSCRKLHRLARSVIILDEAQAVPAHLLEPILDVLRQLCLNYGSTVILSTATQPAFEVIPEFARLEATEIVTHPASHFQVLKRVDYQWRIDQPMAWPEVADMMRREKQALAVVNTKADAMALLDALDDPDSFHLSTLLCGAHRRRVLEQVKGKLKSGESCRLVATQVIEAGVDIDFPSVFRALAPLDSIIQSAGRCNREGRLELGRVLVFRSQSDHMPRGGYITGANVTKAWLSTGTFDPDDPEEIRRYFQRVLGILETDTKNIQNFRRELNYPEVSKRFRMIDEATESVLVPYGTDRERDMVCKLLGDLRTGAHDARHIHRKLRPYTVSIYAHQSEAYKRQGLVSEITPGLGQWRGVYDPIRGLTVGQQDPDLLVA